MHPDLGNTGIHFALYSDVVYIVLNVLHVLFNHCKGAELYNTASIQYRRSGPNFLHTDALNKY